jgi:hypothetical protein
MQQPYPKLARIDAMVLLRDAAVATNPFENFTKKTVLLANGTEWAS